MTPRGPRWLPFVLCWVLLALMSALWSVATPISASPDEPDHFVKAASVARGDLVPRATAEGSVVVVPKYVAFTHSQTCFAYQPEKTADCSPSVPGNSWANTTATTTAGTYNPVYYFLVGWPSLIFHNEVGLYAMRIASGIVGSLMLALAFVQLLELRRRGIALLSFAAATTPMVLFLMSSVNPNSLETTATLSTFVTGYMIVKHPDPRLLGARSITLMLSAALAVTMRGLSPLWVAIALLAPLILAGGAGVRALLRQPWIRVATGVIAAATLYAIVWVLASNSLGGVAGSGTAGPDAPPGVGQSPLRGFAQIFFLTFDYARGIIGHFGWLDTPAPGGVYFVWSVLVGTLVLVAAAVTRGRTRWVALGLLLAVVFIPPVVQAIYIHGGGIIWQGRYILPVFVCLVMALGFAISEALDLSRYAERTVIVLTLAAWTLAQIDAFATEIRRYAVGLSGGIAQLVLHPVWSPPFGVIPGIAAFSIVTTALAVMLVRVSWRTPTDTTRPSAVVDSP